MKFTIDRSLLFVALQKASPAITSKGADGNKTAIDFARQHFRVEAADGHVRLTGTDTSLWALMDVPAEVEIPGMVIVPADKMLSVVKSAPQVPMTFSVEKGSDGDYGSVLQVDANGVARWSLKFASDEKYPGGIPSFDKEQAVECSRHGLMQALKLVGGMAGTDTRKKLTYGLYFGDKWIVGLNDYIGGRMPNHLGVTDVFLPPQAIPMLLTVLKASTDMNVWVQKVETYYVFKVGVDVYQCRRTTDVFSPGAATKIDETFARCADSILRVPKAAFTDAIDRAETTTGQDRWLVMSWLGSVLSITTRDDLANKFIEAVHGCEWTGNADVTWNRDVHLSWFRDALKLCEGDTVEIGPGPNVEDLARMMLKGSGEVTYCVRLLRGALRPVRVEEMAA